MDRTKKLAESKVIFSGVMAITSFAKLKASVTTSGKRQ